MTNIKRHIRYSVSAFCQLFQYIRFRPRIVISVHPYFKGFHRPALGALFHHLVNILQCCLTCLTVEICFSHTVHYLINIMRCKDLLHTYLNPLYHDASCFSVLLHSSNKDGSAHSFIYGSLCKWAVTLWPNMSRLVYATNTRPGHGFMVHNYCPTFLYSWIVYNVHYKRAEGISASIRT